MIQTVEATIDANGQVRLLGPVNIDAPRRALVTILEEPVAAPGETALAEDRLQPEEDAAWAHLQPSKSI